MDDTLTRLLVVLSGTLVVVFALTLARARRRRPTRIITDTGLEPGIYLLSSGGCGPCEAARARLELQVGPGGYTEFTWDDHAETFQRLRIVEVPSTLVVTGNGLATWHSGVPNRIVEGGGP